MTATIVIDDGTNPPAAGSTDNPLSFIGAAHTLSNFDDTGVLAHRWTLVDKPIASGATLTTPTASTTDLTPDVPGSYLIRLETYLDGGATDLDDVDEQVIGVRFDIPFDWLIPAAGETVQQSATRGWAEAREQAIRALRNNLMPQPGTVQVGAVTATIGRLVLFDPSGGTFQIDAPAAPVAGDRWALKNTTIDATAVTIDGNGNSIEDPNTSTFLASYSLAGALNSIDYLFDGTNWVIV